jgi:16S rRNA (guanine966-N2)-methyltransferase
VRVIAGSLRGRRIAAPTGTGTRPTGDRVREAVFNAVGSRIRLDGAVVVDLFAGSGALGIEALSRGAADVTFVERDPRALRVLRRNLDELGVAERATVVAADAGSWRPPEGSRPDLVLADPPYAFAGWAELLGGLAADLVVAESDDEVTAPGWVPVRARRYGAAFVTLLVPGADAGDAGDEH